jgi:hypothetical protein
MEVSFDLPRTWRDFLIKANTRFHESWHWQQDMATIVRSELGTDLHPGMDFMQEPLTMIDPAVAIRPFPVGDQLAAWQEETALAVIHSLPSDLQPRAEAALQEFM